MYEYPTEQMPMGGAAAPVLPTSFPGAAPALDESPRLNLSQERRDTLARSICEAVQTARSNAGRRAHLLKLAKWKQYYEGITYPKTFPWKGAANVWVPLTLRSVRGVCVRLATAILKAEPMLLVRAASENPSPEEQNAARTHERWMHRQLASLLGVNDEDSVGRDVLLATSRDGTSFTQLSWRSQEIRKRGYIPRGDNMDLVEETENFIGPDLEFVSDEDLEIVPATARSLSKAVGVLRRKWVRLDELKRGEKRGMYHDVERLKTDQKPNMDNAPATATANAIEGMNPGAASADEAKEYQILEGLWRADVNNDGLEETLLVTTAFDDQICLRVEYYPYLHGEPYFQRWRIVPRDNRLYGMGIAGMVESLNEEATTIRNQRLDAGTLKNIPIFKAKKGAFSGDGSLRNISLYPGSFVWLEDMDALAPLPMGDINPELFTEESTIIKYGEDITGITDMRLGRTSTGRRTLGEISQVMNESSTTLEEMVACASNSLVTIAKQVAALYRQFRGGTGEDLTFLDVPVEYVPNSNLAAANKQAVLQMALQLYAIISQNPLVAQDPQRLWAVTRDLLNAFPHIHQPEDYIGPPPPPQGQQGLPPGMEGILGAGAGQQEAGVLGEANQFLTRQNLYQSLGGEGY